MKRVFLSAIVTFIFISCNTRPAGVDEDLSVTDEVTVQPAQAEAPERARVKLNNGLKWSANIETTEGINQMKYTIGTLSHGSNLEEYHAAGKKLDAEFSELLQKCTMKGEAHDQLHNYLMPLNELIKKLQSANTEECEGASVALNQHLNEYERYFITVIK